MTRMIQIPESVLKEAIEAFSTLTHECNTNSDFANQYPGELEALETAENNIGVLQSWLDGRV